MSECCEKIIQPMEFTKGNDKDPFTFSLSDSKTCRPIDISAVSEIKLRYLNTDESVLLHTLTGLQITIVSGTGGIFQDKLSLAEGNALNPGNNDINLQYTIGLITKSVLIKNGIIVTDLPF